MIKRLRCAGATSFPDNDTNPVLAAGEIGIDTDSGVMKRGNGTSAFTDLPMMGSGGSNIDGGQL